MDDIWQCRHSREGCDSYSECRNRDHAPQVGPTPLAQCIADQEWNEELAQEDWENAQDEREAYERDMAKLAPWNEGIK